MKRIYSLLAATLLGSTVLAQGVPTERISTSKFRQLEQELPTPNVYRTASGAPGHEYYQNKASYDMSITLDETTHRIDGSEWITYTNNSPDALTYLWVQLDQNMRKPGSMTDLKKTGELPKSITPEQVQERYIDQFEGGFVVDGVSNARSRRTWSIRPSVRARNSSIRPKSTSPRMASASVIRINR